MLPAISEFSAKIPLDAKLWEAIKCFAETDEAKKLPKLINDSSLKPLKDFREAGADLASEKRHRLEEISSELAKVTQKFSENVLDATNNWQMVVKEEDKLSGLPSAKSAAKQAAIKKFGDEEGANCWLFTLHAPSMLPVLQYLENEELRKKIWTASDLLGTEEPFDNQDLIKKYSHFARKKQRYLESLISQM